MGSRVMRSNVLIKDISQKLEKVVTFDPLLVKDSHLPKNFGGRS